MADTLRHDNMRSMLRQLSGDQLLELLRQDAMGDGISRDGAYVALILEVLEEKETAEGRFCPGDVSRALRDFQTKYNTPEGEGLLLYGTEEDPVPTETETSDRPQRKRRVRRYVLAAAAAAVLLTVMIPTALGNNLFEFFGHWDDEFFHMEPSSSGEDGTTPPPPVITEFDTLQDALDACRLENIREPQWLPEGYGLLGVDAADVGGPYPSISASYRAGKDFLFFSANREDFVSDSTQEDGTVEEYDSNGIHYCLSDNQTSRTIVWYDADMKFTINGIVSADALKKIAESMYS